MQNYGERLSRVVNRYMSRTSGLKEYCDRCLQTRRWGGNVVLMVVDAAFTSIGLNYFTAVVPGVMRFEEEMVATGKIPDLGGLGVIQPEFQQRIWRNWRSWQVAKNAASYLHELAVTENLDDRGALRCWTANSCLDSWRRDPIGKISGVGITTYQYLRMMGGMDTAMPDKIVRRVVRQILDEAEVDMPTEKDMELVSTIERMARLSDYRPIEICWMTWLIQSEGGAVRMEKYGKLLDRI